MESLQLAQMLADLSSLNAAETQAATALVNANKQISKPERVEVLAPAKGLERPEVKRTASTSRTASPAARLDKYGRRILMSPPLSRTSSAQGSHPGTPRRESDAEDEIDRASTLMALYEIRAKLKQQDNSSLIKAREKIAALAARQQADTQKGRREPVKHYPYTYPK